jgi:hypothetical protein
MRRMSVQRRRVVVMAASVSAMSGMGPLLFEGHTQRQLWMRCAWLGVIAMLLVVVIALMVRLKRDEGCA